ncbi:MAG: transcriptional regulator BldD [Actinomycetota bacterium]
MADDEAMPATYAKRVGERLRAIRLQKGVSLHDVEGFSSKEFKASVLGAYERGERSISVPRLQRLAMLYGVPVDQLLPRFEDATITLDVKRPAAVEGGLRIDLPALVASDSPEATAVARYAQMIQMQRGDFNGRVLTVRDSDIRTIAAVLDLTPEALAERLQALGLRSPVLV